MKARPGAGDTRAVSQALMEMTGAHWVAVSFHSEKPSGFRVSKPAAFCAAASRAPAEPALLKVADIPCAGARYALGAGPAAPPPLKSFLPAALMTFAEEAGPVKNAPRLASAPAYVGFGLEGQPASLYISFMLVEYANRVVQLCSALKKRNPRFSLSGGMSFCSEGAAAAFNSGRVSMSLGCPKAVKTAGLQGQVCVCLPAAVAEKFAGAWRRQAVAGAAR
jgi:uncharacterized protein (DUF169 family)